jgi:hypothetical protein
MADNVSKLRLYRDVYNEDRHTDENSLAKALLLNPDVISTALTHLTGKEDKRFSLASITEGAGNMKTINGIEYDWPVIGRMTKGSRVATTILSAQGAGRAKFWIEFESNWFVKGYLIEAPDGTQCLIKGVEDRGNKTAYLVEIASSTNSAATVAITNLAAGTVWSQLFAPVAVSGSRGNESRRVMPSRMRNQITHLRKSYGYEGNVTNMAVNVQLPTAGGGSNTLWWPFEEYQHSLAWRLECESSYLYSNYNRDSNGIIHLKDENGKVIPIGAGLLDQIPNYNTYSTLTASKIKSTVRDALFGCSDAEKVMIDLHTGTGGREEFDNAMKSDLTAAGYTMTDGNGLFVKGQGRDLVLGGFFTAYEHVDGHVIRVHHNSMLDTGPRAQNSPKHPRTGLPLESYRMLFVDNSMYDGERNLLMVTQKNRSMLRWAVAGSTVPSGFTGNDTRANDIDGATIHFLKASGMCIRRATNCLHLECIAS